MDQNKKRCLYVGGLFILLLTVLVTINCKKEQALPPPAEQVLPSKVELSSFMEIEKDTTVTRSEPNATIEVAERKVEDLAGPLLDGLVEREISVLANKMKWDMNLINHIESMKEPDKKINKKWELPVDVLGKTSTDKLFLHVIRSPMVAVLMLYSKDEIGLQRLLNASSTMHEFYMREDLAEGVLQMYREYVFSPEAISDETIISRYSDNKRSENPLYRQRLTPDNITNTKIVNRCMSIMKADKMMLCPQLFPKTKGHERDFLKIMVDRYEKIAELKKIYDNEEDPFGTAIACISPFCIRLAENIDGEFCNKLKGIEFATEAWEKRFIEEIKEYLKNQ